MTNSDDIRREPNTRVPVYTCAMRLYKAVCKNPSTTGCYNYNIYLQSSNDDRHIGEWVSRVFYLTERTGDARVSSALMKFLLALPTHKQGEDHD